MVVVVAGGGAAGGAAAAAGSGGACTGASTACLLAGAGSCRSSGTRSLQRLNCSSRAATGPPRGAGPGSALAHGGASGWGCAHGGPESRGWVEGLRTSGSKVLRTATAV